MTISVRNICLRNIWKFYLSKSLLRTFSRSLRQYYSLPQCVCIYFCIYMYTRHVSLNFYCFYWIFVALLVWTSLSRLLLSYSLPEAFVAAWGLNQPHNQRFHHCSKPLRKQLLWIYRRFKRTKAGTMVRQTTVTATPFIHIHSYQLHVIRHSGVKQDLSENSAVFFNLTEFYLEGRRHEVYSSRWGGRGRRRGSV